ncbi:MAG: hypothetical protein D3910_21190 [Candidatus Electrothrix sp. ATG2]|nr:hypothetical protein [Candidatus Electrothrix sp. ATG2]
MTTSNKRPANKQARIENFLKINNYPDNWHPEEFFSQGQAFIRSLKAGKVWLILHNVTPNQSAEVSFKIADQSPKGWTGKQGYYALNYTAFMKTILCARKKRNSSHIYINNDIDDELQRAVLSGLKRWGFITREQEIKLSRLGLLIVAR